LWVCGEACSGVQEAAERVYHGSSVRALLASAGILAATALLAAGCGGGSKSAGTTTTIAPPAKATCAYRHGWQLLANKIGADVYCPGFLPDPLTSQINGQWSNINSVSKDRSYLESFVWQDTDTPGTSGELHVNLRGYPDRTTIPRCLTGLKDNVWKPCFAGVHGSIAAGGIKAKLYTVNQDADTWHLLLLWRHKGGLYTLSEHLAPPLDYRRVIIYLKQELGSLVLIAPSHST
jgi:hypothetical protein